MAENKKSFLLYNDLNKTVNKLPNDKAGELFKIILSYVNDENPQVEDLVLDIAFEPIKQQLKRDLVKYENIVERNRNNGKKGGRPKNPEKPSGLFGNPDKPKKADSDTDNDSDTDKEINNIYSLYPTKCIERNTSTGKTSKNKDQIKRLLKTHTSEELKYKVNRYLKEAKEGKSFIQNFRTFLNNLPDYNNQETVSIWDFTKWVYYKWTHENNRNVYRVESEKSNKFFEDHVEGANWKAEVITSTKLLDKKQITWS